MTEPRSLPVSDSRRSAPDSGSRRSAPDSAEPRPPAVLVSVQLPGVSDEQHAADVAELSRLVKTLGLEVIGEVTQRRGRVSPATVLGEGKLQELAKWTGGDGKTDPTIVPQVTTKSTVAGITSALGQPT